MTLPIVERLRHTAREMRIHDARYWAERTDVAADTIEELVEVLKIARKQVVAAILSPQMSVEAAEVAVAPIDATLRKIGDYQ